uniref:hypothetical protein n=1 Tax=Marinobacterium profundum TaxID=1714300 RepID=UPI0008330350|nr:hypothetical protein [Marinobacterium profundum]
MKFLALVLALVTAQAVTAQTELSVFGAMVEGPGGEPMATATSIGGEPGRTLYLTSSTLTTTDGICLRAWDKGACHPVLPGQGGPVAGVEGLSVIAVSIPNDEIMAKFSDMRLTAQPLVGVFDPKTDGRQVQFVTQGALGGWESPLDPAEVTGQSGRGFTLRSGVLNPMSVGAPVVHPRKGLVGVISAAQSGSARVSGISELIDAIVNAGFPVPPEIRPTDSEAGELPRQVDSELGRFFVFSDNSSIAAGLTGFYGPSQGLGFDENFVANLDYSVWSLDLGASAGALLATGAKTLPLIRSGMPLEAPFRGTPPDVVATCVIHETPASQGRRAVVMQFWRAVPERYNDQTNTKSYDEAAPPLTGWADGASPCAQRIAQLDAKRIAALRGDVQVETPATARAETWRWSSVEAGGRLNVSGMSGATRANIYCYQSGDNRIAGMALTGDLLKPLAAIDVSGGRIVNHVGGKRFGVGLMRSGDMIALEPFQDGEAFVTALEGAGKITLEWEDSNGVIPLGIIDLTAAAEHLAAQREDCRLAGASKKNSAQGDEWSLVDSWPATGQAAASVAYTAGQVITLGCTESRELVVAIEPADGVSDFRIGGQTATEQGRADRSAYAFFPKSVLDQLVAGADISFQIGGAHFELPGPTGLGEGAVGATCRE